MQPQKVYSKIFLENIFEKRKFNMAERQLTHEQLIVFPTIQSLLFLFTSSCFFLSPLFHVLLLLHRIFITSCSVANIPSLALSLSPLFILVLSPRPQKRERKDLGSKTNTSSGTLAEEEEKERERAREKERDGEREKGGKER